MRRVAGPVAATLLVAAGLAGCGSGGPTATGPVTGRTTSSTTGPAVTSPGPPSSPPTARSVGPRTDRPTSSGPVDDGATPAPAWLGLRVLPRGPDGYGRATTTPKELRPRRIITTDTLPPPADGAFHSRVSAVPPDVAQRSTWSSACPVTLKQLRYVTVGFVGFDGRAHTGELLVNRTVAADVVTVFRALFAARWPIEEMRITNRADLAAPMTGDGNNTSAFVCRPVRGASIWSQHAYGRAIDVNPFQNPYISGRTVLPELARYYTRRDRARPGMNTPGSVAARAFGSVGWGWGGHYRTKKDWMHFSSTGG
jgi:D-alanyl-D-alanine carboxypeptidase